MKLWTYAEARDKVLLDQDLQDQEFVTPNELIGYFNEGIEEAESEILKIDEEYFLAANQPMAVQAGTSSYAYPDDIYAFKVRGIMYNDGSKIYEITKVSRSKRFGRIAELLQFGDGDDYQWYPSNDSSNGARINFAPAMRDTGTVSPTPSATSPISISYIRQANRIPLLGEYVPNYDQVWQATTVDTATDLIHATTGLFVTGDKVKLSTTGTMPGGLSAGTVYFVSLSGGFVGLSTSLANAQAGTKINLTSTGSGILTFAIAATQTIVDNTLIDIPEFTKFVIQWAKCRCMTKEGDPRLEIEAAALEQQRKQMVETLTDAQPDDQNEITPDFSAYTDMS